MTASLILKPAWLLLSRRITVDEAREFWADKSQHIMGARPEVLPETGVQYWADGPVCLAFHQAPWPDVWMVHCGMMRAGLGQYVTPTVRTLNTFWEAQRPQRIVAWMDTQNRHVIALSKRCGFVIDGQFSTNSKTVTMAGWRA